MRPVVCTPVLLALACATPDDDGGTASVTVTNPTAASTHGASTDGSITTDDGGGSSSEAADSGDAPLPGACVDEGDCRLHGDCCGCEAYARDEQPPACEAACERTMCESWGITEVLCSHSCRVRLVECDPMLVMCDEVPPGCERGFAPSIEARCWTRHCVPVELCMPH